MGGSIDHWESPLDHFSSCVYSNRSFDCHCNPSSIRSASAVFTFYKQENIIAIKLNMTFVSGFWIALLAANAVFNFSPSVVDAQAQVGITYGRNAQNLPTPYQVADFLTRSLNYSIPIIRLLDDDVQVLDALKRSTLVISVTIPNNQIPSIASSQSAADAWVNQHIAPFSTIRFRYVAVGNEPIPGPYASCVAPAMRNLHKALISSRAQDVQVTTSVSPRVLGDSSPPSVGQFKESVSDLMSDVVNFLNSVRAPLLVNAYPYFALVNDVQHIDLEHALFEAKTPLIIDGDLKYFNLFDAMVDAFVAATAKVVGGDGVRVVVSETGWPVKGNEPYTSLENAGKYNRNLKEHVERVGGTPRMKDYMEVYIYSMFNEDLKPDLVGRYFGTFNKDFTQIYPIWH